jgi:hypothetical protein
MQSVGFIADFILYLLPALLYPQLTKPGSGVKWFQTLYFLCTSFIFVTAAYTDQHALVTSKLLQPVWTERNYCKFCAPYRGRSCTYVRFSSWSPPNATLHPCAAQPTGSPRPSARSARLRQVRHLLRTSSVHLLTQDAAILYNYTSSRTRFWVVCWLGLVGFLLTAIFLPDTTGLDLREQERYWAFVREGRAAEYCGPAVHPRHLSRFERWVQHRARFDGARDRVMRLEEIRAAWERVDGARTGEHEVDEDDSTLVDGDVGKYFEQEKAARSGASLPTFTEKKVQ